MDCIKCNDVSGNPLKYLYQWDTGQTVGISNIDTSLKLEVQICSIDSDEAMVIKHSVNNSGISACIPDILLQRSVPIMLYVCQCPDDESSRTIGAARIVVAPKARPTDYVYTESEVLNYRTLDAQMAEIRSNLSSFEDKIPATLPNPYPLSINGQNYDGSQPVNVSIAGDEVSGDFIPVPETAEVGQTIVVKAVDENGKPTEWEATSLSKKPKLLCSYSVPEGELLNSIEVNTCDDGATLDSAGYRKVGVRLVTKGSSDLTSYKDLTVIINRNHPITGYGVLKQALYNTARTCWFTAEAQGGVIALKYGVAADCSTGSAGAWKNGDLINQEASAITAIKVYNLTDAMCYGTTIEIWGIE